ncbi:hypothetical protein [Fontibacillus sp. BL9]|uniref:hypothetical protein n=1 Tax=Fontibacillus sp. BL9 TaxID=3389971 RepID=UPI00397BCB36
MAASFESAHEAFFKSHMERRSPEWKGQLVREHGHREIQFLKNVWWPLFGNLKDLHPEYEVRDWRGKSFFRDFAYLPGRVKWLIEIKEYGSYMRETGRRSFAEELNRELFLQALGFRVIKFAFDDVEHRPELCRYLLQMLISRYQAGQNLTERPLFAEMEVVRLALNSPHPIHPQQVALHFNIDCQAAVQMMQSLCSTGWLRPVRSGSDEDIPFYELIKGDATLDETEQRLQAESIYKKRNLPMAETAPEGIYG